MKITLLIAATAIALSAPAVPHAHADDGHWVDARRHMSLENSPNGSEATSHFDYAKDICRSKTGQVKGAPPAPGWADCMKGQGYVWLWDSAAQVAANRKAEQDAQNRAQRIAVGQALGDFANDLNRELNRPRPQPQSCNGYVRGGYVDMTCN